MDEAEKASEISCRSIFIFPSVCDQAIEIIYDPRKDILILADQEKEEATQMEMEDQLYDEIATLCEEGDDFYENDQYEHAIERFNAALELVPEPKVDWETSTWIYSSLGDVYFTMGEFEKAKHCFYDAYNCPGGIDNPFILIRLGECLYEREELEKAKEFLLRAYMLEGEEIFSDEDDKYIELIGPLIAE